MSGRSLDMYEDDAAPSGGSRSLDAYEDEQDAPEPVQQMGSTPGGMTFSASPTEVQRWNSGAATPGTTDVRELPRGPDMDFSAQPMAVPQTGGLEGTYDRLFNGNAQRSYDKLSEGVGKSGVTFETPRAYEAGMAATMGPVAGGVASGAVSGLRNSQAQDFGGRALDTAEGALYGGLAGGAGKALGAGSKYFGKAAQWAGDKIGDFGNNPMVQKAAQWAGASAGGTAGTALGAASPFPGGAAAGGFAGTAAGGYLGSKAIPAAAGAIRGVGNAAQGLGSPAMQALGAVTAGKEIGGQLDRGTDSPSNQSTDAGRGNLLGEAALGALQNDPSVLGKYAGEFAKAAASKDTGAVNALINKLAQKDPEFRTGPMIELQRMTAEF